MDLWEEEEDADDARPTIVAERPTADQPDVRVDGAEEAQEPAPSDANSGRSSLVRRLIEQGALEDERMGRPSAEALRNSEVDELTVIDDKEPFSTAYAAQRGEIAHVESEPATEDAVPTVSVKRPLPASSTPLPISSTPLPAPNTPLPGSHTPRPAAPLPASSTPGSSPAPAPAMSGSRAEPRASAGTSLLGGEHPVAPKPRADRDVTERISIPSSGMVGSIAPATRTFRPGEQRKAGLPFWQTALAAVVLLGGGLTIAKLRSERASRATSVSATSITARPAMPSPPAEPAAPLALAEAPAPALEPPSTNATEAPTQPLPSAAPEPIAPPQPAQDQPPASTARKSRAPRVERRALAATDPSEPVAAADPTIAAAPSDAPAAPALPAQPSREQVSAALNAVVPALQKCVGDRHDMADVTLTVRPAGFVSYAVVSGPYAGSSEGSCIARAVKSAKFPAFSDPNVRITYPFQL